MTIINSDPTATVDEFDSVLLVTQELWRECPDDLMVALDRLYRDVFEDEG